MKRAKNLSTGMKHKGLRFGGNASKREKTYYKMQTEYEHQNISGNLKVSPSTLNQNEAEQ